MHRDLKVGLVLGVALVAVVAALFFRRETPEPHASEAPERLQDAHALDEQVATLPGAPYIIEEQPAAGTASEDRSPPGRSGSGAAPLSGAGLPALEHAVQGPSDALPLPIVVEVPADAVPGAALAAPRVDALAGPRTHVIQSGDTLYDLAEHYLGRGERFRDIFEANRNVLSRPDRLPLGVEIVIPSDGRATSPVAPRSETAGPVAPATAAPAAAAAGSTTPPEHAAPHDAAPQRAFGEVGPDPVGAAGPPPLADTATAGAAGPSGGRRYTVRPGDTLIGIAIREYGDAQFYYQIYQANRATLPAPDEIHEGMVLILP